MANTTVPTSDGKIPFKVGEETFETYYKLYGDLANRTRPPLIGLHGGPGLTHDCIVPLSDLAAFGVPVIIYDQLGNGLSTHLREKPPSFWTVDLFIDELVNLLNHFNIADAFELVGHSWGGIVGSEFEVRRQPKGLRHLILSDSLAASSLWNQSTMQLLQTFPKDVQEGVAGGMKDPVKFYAALKQFHAKYACTIRPYPPEFQRSFDAIFGPDGDPTVAAAPILKDWTIIERLHVVRVPTFVINGRNDIAQDFVVAPFFERIKRVKWVTMENSSHTPFWEERERYMQLVNDFLKLE
ncbi:proline-specific peptidase [Wolfiporia cocos MD-104 SS10]|uniref:Proline-specific peptidase n=1 Tax=Wolfiporia cocos (strain MD-104) TaxID=742152 RepID=A0A2H3JB29_WOLCO|nr:proline-specific peptidase [Wolfiporia cocos MD-104 SS10]